MRNPSSHPRPLSFSLARYSSALAVATALSMAHGPSAEAASQTWDGGYNFWDAGTTGFWNGGAVWTNGNDAVFGGLAGGVYVRNTGLNGPVQAGNLTFNTTGYLIEGGALILSNSTSTLSIGSGKTATIKSALTESVAGRNVIVSGGGKIVLTGANTYTGSTTITGSVLEANVLDNGGQASSIGASTAASSKLVLDGGTLRYVGAGANTDRSFTITGSGATIDASGSGTLNFTGSSLSYTGNVARTLTLTGSTGGNTVGLADGDTFLGVSDFKPVIEDFGIYKTSVTKTGTGAWKLSGNNTYTGKTSILGGTLVISDPSALGSSTNVADLVLDGGKLLFAVGSNSGDFGRSFTLGSNGGAIDAADSIYAIDIGSLAAPVEFTGTGHRTLTLGGASQADNLFELVLGDKTAVTEKTSLLKTGAGTWTLIPAGNHTYTGTTKVEQGTLKVSFVQSASPNNVLSASSSLVLAGGRMEVGSGAGSNNQTFAGLSLTPGASTLVADTYTNVGSLTINVGGISRQSGSTISFVHYEDTVGSSHFTTTATNDSTGILGAYATIDGKEWATVGAGNELKAYTGYSSLASGGVINNSPSTNLRLSGGGTNFTLGSTVTTINTLKQDSIASPGVVDVTGKTLRLGASGGILLGVNNFSLTVGLSGQSGVLTAGGADNTAGELFLNNQLQLGTLTVNATVADNGTGAVKLIKSGPGSVVLNANNTFTGGAFLGEGPLRLGNDGALGTGLLTVTGSTAQLTSVGATARTLSNYLYLNGDLQVGDSNNTGTITFGGVVDLVGGNRRIFNPSSSVFMTGLVTNGGLVKEGAGTLSLLNASNNYSGGTFLNGGTLDFVPGALGTGLIVIGKDLSNLPSPAVTFSSLGGRTPVQNNLLITNDFTFGRNGVAEGTEFSGSIDLAGVAASSRSITFSGIPQRLSGAISNGGFTKLGSADVFITGSDSPFSGGMIISAGGVRVTGQGLLGANVAGNDIFVRPTGANTSSALRLQGPSNFNALASLNMDPGNVGSSLTAVLGLGSGFAAGSGNSINFNNSGTGLQNIDLGSGGPVAIALDGIRFADNLTAKANLVSFTPLWLGATASNGIFTGSTLDAGSSSVFRLGGGGGTLTVSSANVLTGAASLVVGSYDATNRGLTGTVFIQDSQSFTGATPASAVTIGSGGTLVVGKNGALGNAANGVTLDTGTLNLRMTGAYGQIDSQYAARNIAVIGNSTINVDPLGGTNYGVLTVNNLSLQGANRSLTFNGANGSNLELRVLGTTTLDHPVATTMTIGANTAAANWITLDGVIGETGSLSAATTNTADTPQLTNLQSTVMPLMYVGLAVSGTGIAPGSKILLVDVSNRIITLDKNTTGAVSNVTFANAKSLAFNAGQNNPTLILGANNTYTGTTTINRGTMVLANLGAAGTATSGLSLSPTSGVTGTLDLRSDGGGNFDFGTLTLGGSGGTGTRFINVDRLTSSGTGSLMSFGSLSTGTAPDLTVFGQLNSRLQVTGATTIGANFQINVRGTSLELGAINGAFSLTKADTGTLILGGTGAFTALTVAQGTLVAKSIVAGTTDTLGAAASVTIGGTGSAGLLITGASTTTMSKNIVIAGTNNQVLGSLDAGAKIFSGTVTLGGNLILNAPTSGGMTMSGIISETTVGSSVTIGSAASGVLTTIGGTPALNIGDVTFTKANTFTGGLTVHNGIVTGSAIDPAVSSNGPFGASSSGATSSTLTLNGGTLSLIGQSTPNASTNANHGNLTFSGGSRLGVFDKTYNDTFVTRITANSLVRSGSGTLTIVPSGANGVDLNGDIRVKVNTPPALVNGIAAPYLVVTTPSTTALGGSTADFVSVSATDLTRFSTYTAGVDLGTNTSATVVNQSAPTSLTASRSAYALKLGGTLTMINGLNNYTLNLGAGGVAGLILNSDAGLTGGILNLGVNEGLVFVGGTTAVPGASTISSKITGVAGSSLTKFGPGTLTLSGAGNDYRGATNINQGTLKMAAANMLPVIGTAGGVTTSAVTIATEGVLDLNNFNTEIGSLAGNFGSKVNVGTATLLVGRDGTSTSFNGQLVGGVGSVLKKVGAGRTILTNTRGDSNANTLGSLIIDNGQVRVYAADLSSGSAFSVGNSIPSTTTITLRGGTLEFYTSGDNTTSQQTLKAGNNIIVTGGNSQLSTDRINASENNKMIELGTLTVGINQFQSNTGNSIFSKFVGSTTLTNNALLVASGEMILEGQVTDGGSGFTLNKGGGSNLMLNSASNSYSGGTVVTSGNLLFGTRGVDPIRSSGSLFVPNSLAKAGTGEISVQSQGVVRLNDSSNLNTNQTVRVWSSVNAGASVLDIRSDRALSDYNLRASGSGALLLSSGGNNGVFGTYTQALNLSNIGDGTWGLAGGVDTIYTASTMGVGANNTYRFYGTSAGVLLLQEANVLTGTANVELGRSLTTLGTAQSNLGALIQFRNDQDYTGNTIIHRVANRGSIGTRLDIRGTLASPTIENYARLEANGNGRFSTDAGVQTNNVVARPGSSLRLDYDYFLSGFLYATGQGEGGGNAGGFTNKWGDNTTMLLDGSQLDLVGGANIGGNAKNTEIIGGLTFKGGSEVFLERRQASSMIELTLNGPLTRSGLGTLAIRTNTANLGSTAIPGTGDAQRFTFANATDIPARGVTIGGTAPGTTVAMVAPYLFDIGQSRFLDYSPTSTTGFVDAAFTVTNSTSTFGGGSNNGTALVLQQTADVTTVGSGTDIWALRTDTNISGANPIMIRSGGLAANNGNGLTISAPLNFSNGTAVEADIWTNTSTNSLTINGAITANNLTKNGLGRLILGGTNSGLVGTLQMNGGTLNLQDSQTVSALTNITLHGNYLNNDGTFQMPRLELRSDTAATFAPSVTVAQYVPYAEISVDRIGASTSNLALKVPNFTIEGGGTDGTSIIFQNGNDYDFSVNGKTTLGLPGNTAPIGLGVQNNNGTNQVILVGQVTGPAAVIKNNNGPLRFQNGSTAVSLNGFGVSPNDLSGGITVNDGTLEFQLVAPAITASNISGQKALTGLSSTANLFVGQTVSGTGIAANSFIASIDSATQVTLNNATSGAVSSVTFTSTSNPTVSVANASGTKVLSGLASTANLYVGMAVTGTGVAGSTTIASVDSPTQVTLNNNTTASVTSAVFYGMTASQMLGTGPLLINRGSLRLIADFNNFNPLAHNGNHLTVAGPMTFQFDRSSAGSVQNLGTDSTIFTTLNSPSMLFASNAGISGVWNGSTVVNDNPVFNTRDLTFVLGGGSAADTISGAGKIIKTGAQPLNFSSNAANTFTGGLDVTQGLVRASTINDTFGAGPIRISPDAGIIVNSAGLGAASITNFAVNSTSMSTLALRSTAYNTVAAINGLLPTSRVTGAANQGGMLAGDNTVGGFFNWINGSDLSTLGNGYWFIGAITSNTEISGTAAIGAGAGGVYRFGGGGAQVFFNPTAGIVSPLVGANQLVIGKPLALNANGSVFFNQRINNTYTGGTTISRVRDGGGGFTVAQMLPWSGYTNTPFGTGAVEVYGNLNFQNTEGSAVKSGGGSNNNSYTFHPGSRLIFENTTAYNLAANADGRWAGSGLNSGIALNGSSLELLAANSTDNDNTETVGAVSFANGSEIRSSRQGTNWSELGLASLSRIGTGTLTIAHDSGKLGTASTSTSTSDTNRIKITDTTGLINANGMVNPYILSRTDGQFLKYDVTSGLQVITQGTALTDYVATTATTLDGAINAKLLNGAGILSIDSAGTTTLGANLDLYALRFSQDINSSTSGAFNQITIRSGGLTIYGGTSRTINSNLIFGTAGTPAEALIHAGSTASITINGQITASGVTKFGTQALTINQDQLTFAGPWNVNSGVLIIQTPGGLGASSLVNLNGWTGSSAGQTLTELRLNYNSSSADELTFTSGKITALDHNLIRAQTASDRTVRIAAIDLKSTAAGAAALAIPGTIRFQVDGSRSRLNTGAITLFDNYNIHVDSGSFGPGSTTGVAPDSISNAGTYDLIKTGDGVLILGDNSTTFTGAHSITVTEGALKVTHNGSLGSAATTTLIENGGVLEVAKAAFAPTATVTMNPGAMERWSINGARATGYNLGTGVHLQLAATQTPGGATTYGLNGGSIMGYLPLDADQTAINVALGSNITVNVLADSFLGQPYPTGTNSFNGAANHLIYDMGKGNNLNVINSPTVQGASLDIQGKLVGSGAQVMTKVGQDIVTLSNALNSGFSTVVREGVLRAGVTNALPSTKALTVTGDGVFDLNNFNITVSSLAGTSLLGKVLNSGVETKTLTIGDSTNTTYAGQLLRNINLTKVGTGTLTLSGANTHTGVTTLNLGTINVAHPSALSGGGSLTFTGGTLQYSAANQVDYSSKIVGSSSAVSIDTNGQSVTFNSALGATNSGGLTKRGDGTLTLGAVNAYTGSTIVSGGTLFVVGTAMPTTTALQVAAGANFATTDGTARTVTAASVSLGANATLTLDWNGGSVDRLTSTGAATASSNVGIRLQTYNGPSGSGLTLLSAASGLQTPGTTQYYLANNSDYTATLSQSDTAVTIGGYTAVSAPTTLYWQGNKLNGTARAGADNALALSTGTVSNWSTTQGSYTATGLTPGAASNLVFSATGAGTPSMVLGADLSVNSLTFSDAASFTIGGANLLTLLSAGSSASSSAITVTSAANAANLLSTNILLGANQTWNVASGKTLTASGIVSGTSGLVKADTGTLVLSGANTYTGGTSFAGGITNLGSASALGTGGLTFTGGTLQFSASNQVDYSARIAASTSAIALDTNGQSVNLANAIGSSNTGGLTKIGTGTLTLSASNSYTGATTLTAGVLNLAHVSALAGGGALVFTGGSLQYSANNQIDYSAVIANSTSALSIDTNAQTVTYGSALAATNIGGLTKIGTGTLILSGANAYTGATTISTGTLQIGAGGTTGSIQTGSAITNNATLAFNRTNTLLQGVDFASTISGSGGITQAGTGTTILSGANTFNGATVISAGTLQLGNNGASGSLSTSSSITNNGTLAVNRTDSIAQGVAFANLISGTGGFTQAGTGTTTLNGANTYTGPTTVSLGTLVADTASNAVVLSSSSSLVVGGGTFQLKGFAAAARTQIFNGLTINAGSSTVEVNNLGTSTTLDLRSTTGLLGITRSVGGGTVDFRATSGNLNSTTAVIKTHQTNTAGGILGAWATVNSGTDLAANDGSDNIVAYTGYADVTRLSSGSKTIANSALSNVRVIDGTGSAGNLILVAGTTDISTLLQTATGGLVTIAPAAADILRFSATGGIVMGSGASALTIGTAVSTGNITAGGAANTAGELILNNNSANDLTINSKVIVNGTGVVSLTKLGSGRVILAGANTYNGATNVNAGTLAVTGVGVLPTAGAIILGGSTAKVDISGLTASGLTVGSLAGVTGSNVELGAKTLTAGNANNTTFAGSISGTGGGLTKASTGTLTLTGTNTYTGLTTINSGGTLQLGDGVIDGSISTTSSITDNGGLAFNVAVTQSMGKVISGTGSVTKNGPGTLTLTGLNTYSGGTTVNAGTFTAGATNALSTGGNFTLNNIATVMNLGFANASSATTFAWNGGTINVGHSSALLGRTFSVNNAAGGQTLQATAAGINLPNNIDSNVPITVAGTNSVTLSGSLRNFSNFAVNNNVTGGGDTLLVSGSVYLSDAAGSQRSMIFGGNSNTRITGVVSNFNGVSTVNNNLIKTGSGTLTLAAANTYTGTTSINGGTVSLDHASALGGGGGVTFGGGALQYTANNTLDLSSRVTSSVAPVSIDTNNQNVSFATGLSPTNTGGLLKSGLGTLSMSANNAYSGPTNITGGKLSVSGSLSGTSKVVVYSGATLAQTGGSSQINFGAELELKSGSTYDLSGVSSSLLQKYTKLTLEASTLATTIDFGTGSFGNTLSFMEIGTKITSGHSLTINHWTGLKLQDDGSPLNDRFLLPKNSRLSREDLANVAFYDDGGSLIARGAQSIGYDSNFIELVPVPEPSTWALGGLALGLLGYRNRRRLLSALQAS